MDHLETARCLPFRSAKNDEAMSPRIRWRTARRRESDASRSTLLGKERETYPWDAEYDSRNASKLARYGLQSTREERVSRFARESQMTPPSLGDEGDQAHADRVGFEARVSLQRSECIIL